MKIFWIALMALCFLLVKKSKAQFTLRLIVDEVATKKGDEIYVAGSFNNWNAKDEAYKLKPFGTSRKGIVLQNLPAGKYEFKFTRGTFDKVETASNGSDIPNHEIELNNDASLTFSIPGWKDDFPDKAKPNTATPQVIVVDTALFIPQLGRTRRIWAYLPKGYKTSSKSYPVLYMHDGQNLFNEQTAAFGEWKVDETLDSLAAKGKELIVIGIDNGGDKRLTEYNPYDHDKYGKGEGKQYVEFIVNTLKPLVDAKFRTKKDAANTSIAGSSMGGLISMYAISSYPQIFGTAGIFSPAFWIAPSIYADVQKADFKTGLHRLYFYAGGKESDTMLKDTDKMVGLIETKKSAETSRLYSPLGKHDEATWSREFPRFIQFILR